jgi:hypothetical protein
MARKETGGGGLVPLMSYGVDQDHAQANTRVYS